MMIEMTEEAYNAARNATWLLQADNLISGCVFQSDTLSKERDDVTSALRTLRNLLPDISFKDD